MARSRPRYKSSEMLQPSGSTVCESAFLFCTRTHTDTYTERHHQLIFSPVRAACEAIDAAGVMKRLFNYQMKEREERMANDNKLKFAADATTAAKCSGWWQGELLISYTLACRSLSC